jgi:hypothetical protein
MINKKRKPTLVKVAAKVTEEAQPEVGWLIKDTK